MATRTGFSPDGLLAIPATVYDALLSRVLTQLKIDEEVAAARRRLAAIAEMRSKMGG